MTRLDPPRDWDLHTEPDPIPYWQLISPTTGHDDYAFTEAELDELTTVYLSAGAPFTIERHFRLPN